MNRKIALSLILAAAGAVAHADDITIDQQPFTSTLTRAQVMAELQQFRAAGVNPWADDYAPLAHFRSARTRQEVTNEFMASREAMAALHGEDSGSVYLARREPIGRADMQLAVTATDE
jgi:hypothetical protein